MFNQNCSVCDKSGPLVCGKCLVVRYCSREHQKEHWKIHKTSCFPCRVEFDEKLGRFLSASRDIKAGEVIIQDPPLVAGPQYGTNPVCLGCNRGLEERSCKCSDCGFPLCSSACQNKVNHKRECDVIQIGGKFANVTIMNQMNPMYQCITPLRCLWMKLNAPEKWKILMEMEDHVEERKETARYEEVQNFIVKIIRNFFDLQMFTEEEIQKICGILETNGFEVPELSLVALYGYGYLLEHSCIANTTKTFDDRLRLVITAATDIKVGEHITTCYIDPLWGERMRKVHLMKFKYFTCSCRRCLDPSDLGTHLSSVKCGKCFQALMIPQADIMADWKCNACGNLADSQEIEEALVFFYKMKENVSPSIKSFEKFLKETRRHLSENHQFRIEAKLVLLQMYGREQCDINAISDDELKRKQELCHEVLEVANLLAPGLSRIRGLILYELHMTYAEMFRRLHKKFKTSSEGKTLIEKAEQILSEALVILRLETHLKEEMQLTTDGEFQMKMIQEWKKSNATEEPKKNNKNKRRAKRSNKT